MKFYTIENNKKSIFKTFAIYYICMACFCAIRIIASLGVFPSGKVGDALFSIIVQIGILVLLPSLLYCLLIKVKPKALLKTCNVNVVNWRVILISIGIGFLVFFINIAVSTLFNGILSFTGYEFGSSGGGSADSYSVGNFFLELLLVAVLPGICEEFLHRGIVLQGTKHMGFKKSILISSILFALLHFNIQQVAYAFVVGLILGFVSVVSKSLIPSMIIHFMNNAISTYLSFASVNGWVFGDVLDVIERFLLNNSLLIVFIVSAIIMVAVVALLCLFIWLLYKQTILRRVSKAIDKVYDGEQVSDKAIKIKGNEIIIDLLENNTLLNLDFKKVDNPIDIVMPKEKSRYLPRPIEKLFMWGAISLGAIVTLFTYVWGLF